MAENHTLDIPMTEDERRTHEAFHRQQLARRLSAIPSKYRGGFASLREQHPSMGRHCNWVEHWARKLDTAVPARGLFLSGVFGCGKTGLAWAVGRVLMERRVDPVFWYVPDLLREIKASWNDETAPSEAMLFSEATTAPLLILDDFGSETASAWSVGTLAEIVNHRYNHERPIVATSNLSPGQLLSHTRSGKARAQGTDYNGERIASRLGEMCDHLALEGGDLRASETTPKKSWK